MLNNDESIFTSTEPTEPFTDWDSTRADSYDDLLVAALTIDTRGGVR